MGMLLATFSFTGLADAMSWLTWRAFWALALLELMVLGVNHELFNHMGCPRSFRLCGNPRARQACVPPMAALSGSIGSDAVLGVFFFWGPYRKPLWCAGAPASLAGLTNSRLMICNLQ